MGLLIKLRMILQRKPNILQTIEEFERNGKIRDKPTTQKSQITPRNYLMQVHENSKVK